MKQIRLKDRIVKIKCCFDCPFFDIELGYCKEGIDNMDFINFIPAPKCPLENYIGEVEE